MVPLDIVSSSNKDRLPSDHLVIQHPACRVATSARQCPGACSVDTLRTFERILGLEEQGTERGFLFTVGLKQMKAKAISMPAN